MKAIFALQQVQEGKKDIIEKMVEHPVTQDLTTIHEIVEQFKEQVKVITQQYEYFKLTITKYTMSIQRGSRESHKIVFGACWKWVLEKLVAYHYGCCAS